jgi:3-oxoacyl-[acyl-carrier-protein] synthase-1
MNEGEHNTRNVHIIGLGAQTAVGRTALSSATAVLSGISRQKEHPFMIDRLGEPMLVSMAPYLPSDLPLPDRMTELALGAIREALTPLSSARPFDEETPSIQEFRRTILGRPDEDERPAIPLILGLPAPRDGTSTPAEAELTSRLRTQLVESGEISNIEIIATGHSAGLMAIERAAQLLREDRAPMCLACGVDSYMDPMILEWLDKREQLLTAYNPWGFIPGEAAGCVLLAADPIPKRLVPLGQLASVATSREQNLIKTDAVCIGEGLSRAWRGAFKPLNGAQVNQIFCDMNGEPYRADEFGFTLMRFKHHFPGPPPFLAPATTWGDIGAASGPLFVALSLTRRVMGDHQGSKNLIWTSSETGERSAAVIESKPPAGSRGMGM